MIGITDRLAYEDFQFRQTTFSVPIGNIQVAQVDPTRWGIVFSLALGATQQVLAQPFSQLAGGAGLLLTTQMPFAILNFRDHGALVSQAWWAFATAAVQFGVIEILYLPVGRAGGGPTGLLQEGVS